MLTLFVILFAFTLIVVSLAYAFDITPSTVWRTIRPSSDDTPVARHHVYCSGTREIARRKSQLDRGIIRTN